MGLHNKVLVFVLGTFLLLYECRKLESNRFPVYTTESCPRNETEWDKTSSFFNCATNTIFSCFPNEDLTMLLQFCYPSKNIPIEKGICLYLKKDQSGLDVYNCTHFKYGCPTKFYSGSIIYKYPNCTSVGNGCFLADSSCEKRSSARTTHRGQSDWVFVVALLVSIVTLCVLGVCFYKLRKRERGTPNRVIKRNLEKSVQEKLLGPKVHKTKDEVKPQEEEDMMEMDNPAQFQEDWLLKQEEEKTQYTEGQLKEDTLNHWRKDEAFFVVTNATKEVLKQIINEKRFVVVTGHSGCGKSAIIQHIALKYLKEGWDIKPLWD
uniref:Uncharacterized protein LOC111105480 isoform X4 n=1 Tax=Crassostrea virginica TaxID=6565 RepID=A0A8B8AXQ2_CRAVI|nr:uncharacterized protein LOC111105480 isoform X4 [Crassostrea virginica]